MTEGCSLYGYKTNIICYADDILLLSPSATGLQLMLNELSTHLDNLCLSVNPLKTKYIVFKHRKFRGDSDAVIYLKNVPLCQVEQCKYLGVILTSNSDLGPDIDRVSNAFLKQFHATYGKFKFCDQNVLFYLFRTYTSSFYGVELWAEKIKAYQLNKISISYHKAVKITCGMNYWDGNHVACEKVGVPLFKHLLAKRLVSSWHRICSSASPCLANLKYYFRYKGCLTAKISDWIYENYDVKVIDNPIATIFSRIGYVERHEPRSNYVY